MSFSWFSFGVGIECCLCCCEENRLLSIWTWILLETWPRERISDTFTFRFLQLKQPFLDFLWALRTGTCPSMSVINCVVWWRTSQSCRIGKAKFDAKSESEYEPETRRAIVVGKCSTCARGPKAITVRKGPNAPIDGFDDWFCCISCVFHSLKLVEGDFKSI